MTRIAGPGQEPGCCEVGSASWPFCSLLRSSISHARTDAATAMMPISVSAPTIARSASMAPKTPPPESRSLIVALLLSHSFQRSAKLGRSALQQGPRALEIARQRVLMHGDLRHVL